MRSHYEVHFTLFRPCSNPDSSSCLVGYCKTSLNFYNFGVSSWSIFLFPALSLINNFSPLPIAVLSTHTVVCGYMILLMWNMLQQDWNLWHGVQWMMYVKLFQNKFFCTIKTSQFAHLWVFSWTPFSVRSITYGYLRSVAESMTLYHVMWSRRH